VTTTRKYFTLKNLDNQNILAKAALIVTVMLCILSLMLFFLQHVLCSILMIVLMTMIIVLLFLFKTPEQVALVSIKYNFLQHMCNDLPYALDQKTQIANIKKFSQ
jgi:cellulose synthase/poly-beta-1,6-N-acetylglucosamine synthase-like glycosyltransferase